MSERVENRLKIIGPHVELLRFRRAVDGVHHRYLDESFDEKGARQPPEPQPMCFDNVVPVPEPLRSGTRWGYLEAEQSASAAQQSVHRETSGGDWEVEHWGCKYGPLNCSAGSLSDREEWPFRSKLARPSDPRKKLFYYFDTLGAVPCKALQQMSQRWPSLRFELLWCAEWEGYFDVDHLYVFANGGCLHDVEFEVVLPSWEAVREEVRRSINDSSPNDV